MPSGPGPRRPGRPVINRRAVMRTLPQPWQSLRSVDPERPDLDRPVPGRGVGARDPDRLPQVRAFDDVEAGDLFLRLGEWAVGDEKFTIARAYRGGVPRRLQVAPLQVHTARDGVFQPGRQQRPSFPAHFGVVLSGFVNVVEQQELHAGSLRGLARALSCRASRPARDDDHDPAPPALALPARARRAPPPAPGSRRPVAAPRVARQDLGSRLGPLGLVQLVSVVRVHDRRPFVYFALSPRRRIPSPAMDTTRSEIFSGSRSRGMRLSGRSYCMVAATMRFL